VGFLNERCVSLSFCSSERVSPVEPSDFLKLSRVVNSSFVSNFSFQIFFL
jgi:hypothetical protein